MDGRAETPRNFGAPVAPSNRVRELRRVNPQLMDDPHRLTFAQRGVNRWKPGVYICACGEIFPGVNQWHQHRASERNK